jgi:hypothetical protein
MRHGKIELLLLWRIDPLLGNDRETKKKQENSRCYAVASAPTDWLQSGVFCEVGADCCARNNGYNEWCFLCGTYIML